MNFPLEKFFLYSAKIPVVLLIYFQRPVHILPEYDPIEVSCVSIPPLPLESLRQRIIDQLPDVQEELRERDGESENEVQDADTEDANTTEQKDTQAAADPDLRTVNKEKDRAEGQDGEPDR